MNKKKKSPLYKGILSVLSFAAALGIAAISSELQPEAPSSIPQAPKYSAAAEKKEYTLMVYIVGSDLESAAGAATDNINELKSISTDSLHIVCEAGGSLRWQTDGLKPQNNTRFLIENGAMQITDKRPAENMGSASTLADFIAYAKGSYPADKYILALWNHGGGPIGGFGSDELFDNDAITLDRLSSALKAAGCEAEPLDVIGFDACCMASLETALCAAPYADYMIASQEIEPAGGWDYTVMDKLAGLSPLRAAQKIASSYYDKAVKSFSAATVSVTDLKKAEIIAEGIQSILPSVRLAGYEAFSQIRAEMTGCGDGARAKGESDLVDLASFLQLTRTLGVDTSGAESSLKNAVVYTNSGEAEASGLCLYAPYAELNYAYSKLARYALINAMPEYAVFATGFANYVLSQQLLRLEAPPMQADDNVITAAENNKNIKSVYMTVWEKDENQENYYYMTGTDGSVTYDDGVYLYRIDEEWTFLGSEPLCTIELESEKGIYTKFACPVLLDGEKANLIIRYDRENPYGKLMYAIMLTDGQQFSKLIKPLFGGEKITPLYPVEAFADNGDESVADYKTPVSGYKVGKSFVYSPSMQLEALPASESALYGFWFTTYQNNEFFSEFLEVS